jgi:chemotaxis response regulator CheB
MDLELPGMSGIEGIEKIKKQRPKTNVIVVSVYDQPERVFQALCAGAGGYLTKNMQPARLLEAISDIQEGGAPMSTSIARMVVSSFQKNRNSPLTARETECSSGWPRARVILDCRGPVHRQGDRAHPHQEHLLEAGSPLQSRCHRESPQGQAYLVGRRHEWRYVINTLC